VKLLLFDIDGTLLHSHGAGRRLFESVLTKLCGWPVSTAEVSFSGRTDPLIVQETLEKAGLGPKAISHLTPIALEHYAAQACYTPSDIRILPGVEALLHRLSMRADVQLALLTGNLQHTAHLKLNCVDLTRYFPFGAFGSDHADRSELPAIAVERARHFSGHTFSGKDVVVIGDSVLDVKCGRDNGAFTVAVATGLTSRVELAAHQPDVLLDDLTDRDLFYRLVLGASPKTH